MFSLEEHLDGQSSKEGFPFHMVCVSWELGEFS